MRYLLRFYPCTDREPRQCHYYVVRYIPILEFPHRILTAKRAKSNPNPTRFQRKRIRIPFPFTIPSPMLPFWLSRPLDSLRLRYPENRFHVLMVASIIDDSDSGQCMETEEPDVPYSPGTELKFVPHISCDDCGENFAFQSRNQCDVRRFEIHLQTPTHRQCVDARKASRINTEYSIISADSDLNQIPMLQPSSESDVRDSLDGESVIPNKDPNSHFLPRSLSSPVPFQPPLDERMGDHPPDRIHPEKMETDLGELARPSSNFDSEVFDVPEGEDFGDSIYGREQLDRVKNDRKRVAPTSSEGANSCGKGRPGKRRRGKR